MKPKAVIKILVDILMTLALLFLTEYQFWDGVAHERAGAARGFSSSSCIIY